MIVSGFQQSAAALAALVLLTMGTAGCIDGKGGPGKGPAGSGPGKIEIVGGDSVNWGKVPPGVLKHTIRITNVGGDTLQITDVKASCGCTTGEIDRKVLMPGDTANVEVSMDMKERSGPQHKTLTISSNDSSRLQIPIPLSADIQRDVAVEPSVFPIVTTTKVGEIGITEVVVKNLGTTPLTIQVPSIPIPPPMMVTFDMTSPQQIPPGDSLRIVAHVKPLKSETGSANVRIATSSKLVPELNLALTSQINPQVAAQKK